MLTIYQQIQEALDLIEKDLASGVTATEAARAAGMSLRSFPRSFPALTGYRFGEYSKKRRMSTALDRLESDEAPILAIAIDLGYESHEAFTRAFKSEFGVTPSHCREEGTPVVRVGAIELVGEVMMGVLTKTLPRMKAVVFDGFEPEPEAAAHEKMEAWMQHHAEAVGSHRIFGHNIDRAGRLAHDPHNVGYRVLLTVPDDALPFDDDSRVETIDAGTFIVTGIEGSFETEPSGRWITEGWQRLQEMAKRNNFRLHPSHRWFEELLEPVEEGNTRFDLYLEVT